MVSTQLHAGGIPYVDAIFILCSAFGIEKTDKSVDQAESLTVQIVLKKVGQDELQTQYE